MSGLRGAAAKSDPIPAARHDGSADAWHTAVALQIAEPPALDGTLDGFDADEPLQLDHEDQYRRSEEPYAGPEEFSASALVNWTDEALYLGVDVVKAGMFGRAIQPRRPFGWTTSRTRFMPTVFRCISGRRPTMVYGWSLSCRPSEGGR